MPYSRIYRALWLLLFIGLSSGCRRTSGEPVRNGEPGLDGTAKAEQLSPAGAAALESYLETDQLPDLQYPDFQNYRSDVKEFYASTGNTLPWISDRRPSPQAQAIIKVFKLADERRPQSGRLRRPSMGRPACKR